MSDKLNKDEEVNVQTIEILLPNSVKFADLVFSNANHLLSWTDIHNSMRVCRGWSKFVSGPLLLDTDVRKKFYTTFAGNDEVSPYLSIFSHHSIYDLSSFCALFFSFLVIYQITNFETLIHFIIFLSIFRSYFFFKYDIILTCKRLSLLSMKNEQFKITLNR